MIDIHSHIAWGIDDGMISYEDALTALEQAKSDGIKVICSTPHILCGNITFPILEQIRNKQRELRNISKDIKIFFGCELFLNEDVDMVFEKKLFYSLNGSHYLLVEFDTNKDIHDIDYKSYLNSVLKRGYIPVLAHCERYFKRGIDWDILSYFQSCGVIIQINRTSLMNLHGIRNYKNCIELLNHNIVHVVASDTHRCTGSRIEKLSDAYQFIEKHYGSKNAKRLFMYNPYHILSDEKVENMSED